MRINKRKYETNWKDYFVWWPIDIEGNFVWLETVQRRWKRDGVASWYDKWIYRFR